MPDQCKLYALNIISTVCLLLLLTFSFQFKFDRHLTKTIIYFKLNLAQSLQQFLTNTQFRDRGRNVERILCPCPRKPKIRAEDSVNFPK